MERKRESDPVQIYRGYNPRMNKPPYLFVCECGKTFSTPEALEAHRASQGFACAAILEEKFIKLQEEGGRHLQCHCCPKLFKTEEARLAHENKKHPVDPNTGFRTHRGY